MWLARRILGPFPLPTTAKTLSPFRWGEKPSDVRWANTNEAIAPSEPLTLGIETSFFRSSRAIAERTSLAGAFFVIPNRRNASSFGRPDTSNAIPWSPGL
jgi:hypothetical protein